MENEIMKFEEVMEFLNIGKNTLYRLLNNREIAAFKIGKCWKIPRTSVEKYVEKKIKNRLNINRMGNRNGDDNHV